MKSSCRIQFQSTAIKHPRPRPRFDLCQAFRAWKSEDLCVFRRGPLTDRCSETRTLRPLVGSAAGPIGPLEAAPVLLATLVKKDGMALPTGWERCLIRPWPAKRQCPGAVRSPLLSAGSPRRAEPPSPRRDLSPDSGGLLSASRTDLHLGARSWSARRDAPPPTTATRDDRERSRSRPSSRSRGRISRAS